MLGGRIDMDHHISRHNLLKGTFATSTLAAIPGGLAVADEAVGTRPATSGVNGCHLMPGAEIYVAIDNKGLWSNLTKLPNDELAAAVHRNILNVHQCQTSSERG